MPASAQRYTAVAIVLHWAIAIAIAGMIALGWWMGDALEHRETQAQAIAAFQLHKSIGLSILALSVFRLAWRVFHPAPPLPEGMKAWERTLAAAAHWTFYFLIIAMPLTGWLYVSAAWSAHDGRPLEVPTVFFGVFQVPHLFGLSHLEESARATVAGVLEFSHSKLAWGAIVLGALHAGAALKHHFVDRDDVLTRMLPRRSDATPPARAAALAAGFAAILIAASAAIWSFANPPAGAPVAVVHEHNEQDASHQTEVAQAAPEHEHAAGEHEHAPPATAASEESGPPSWRVAPGASSIVFAGEHAGVPFQGRFGSWRADIRFDPADLENSSATVTIETGSAADGVPVHDNALPGREWFDVERHPTAVFRTTSIRARGGDRYEARGTLTLKGRALDIDLPFTLALQGDRVVMDGTTQIDRRQADLGQASDPDAEYVSREINVRIHVEAVRVQ